MERAIPLVVLAVLLSSCTIRFDSNTTIRGDGSGTLALEIGFDEEFRRLAADNGGSTLELTGDLEDVPPGWSAVEFSRDGFEGMRISVEFDSIADLDARLAEFAETSGDSAPPTLVETSGLTRNGHGYDFQTEISNLEEGPDRRRRRRRRFHVRRARPRSAIRGCIQNPLHTDAAR